MTVENVGNVFYELEVTVLRTFCCFYFRKNVVRACILFPALTSSGIPQVCSLVYFHPSSVGHVPGSLEGREGCLFKLNHFPSGFVFILFCLVLATVLNIYCVRNFYITSFQEMVVSSKWQLC